MTRLIVIAMLAVQFAFGVLYALNTPRWQAPDEPAHFNYVRALVETAALPVLRVGDYDQAYLERIKSAKFPPEMSVDSIRYESHQPPLFYVIGAPIYALARAASWEPVVSLRLLNVLLAVIVSAVAYQTFRLVFPENETLQIAGVGIIATVPMHLAMTAAVSNDTLAELIVALILLIAVRRVQGRVENGQFIAFGGVLYGLALLTKTTIYSSAVILVLAELKQGRSLRDRVLVLAPLFGIALLMGGLWFVRNIMVYGINDPFGWVRHDLVVAGQPTAAEWLERFGLRALVSDFFVVSFKSFWAQFGWMGVLVDDRIYVVLAVLTCIASFGAALWLVRLVRDQDGFSSTDRWTWLLLGVQLALVLGAHVYYNLKFVQPQGRYLFPALIPLAAFWAAGIGELVKPRYLPAVFILLYLLLLLLDYISLFWYLIPQLTP